MTEEKKSVPQVIVEEMVKDLLFLPALTGGILWLAWHGPASIFSLAHPSYFEWCGCSLFLATVTGIIRREFKESKN